MSILYFSVLLMLYSMVAGLLGALTGLGGGVIIIPMLVLLFHIDIHYAMGASLISVITTSSGAAAAYLRGGYINIRIGMYLEVAAVLGALLGALLIAFISKSSLAIIFSLLLFLSAYMTLHRQESIEHYTSSHPIAIKLKLNGDYPTNKGRKKYYVQNAVAGFFIMALAGVLSGLLGIGGGIFKVLALDQALRLPYKVATTTSNFMIGMTAAASAGMYFSYGYILPALVFPVMLGVLIGAYCGTKLIFHLRTTFLRIIFSIVICFAGIQMLWNAFQGTI